MTKGKDIMGKIFMRKILFAFFVLVVFLSQVVVFAEPIMELAAPRLETPRAISDDGTSLKPKTITETKKSSAIGAKKQVAKKNRRHTFKKPSQIKVNYDKVSKLIEYGYYEEADRILQGAICRNSKDIKAQSLWMLSLAKQSKLEPAQKDLVGLLKKYPSNSNLHYAQGVVYYQRTTSSNMFYRNNASKLINQAAGEFKKAVELDKNNAGALNAAGVVSLSLDKPKDAKNYFIKALAADKTYSLAIDNLGTIELLGGKLDEAEKKFKQSLIYNTQNTTAMYHLAQIYFQKGDYANALTFLNNALAINPNLPAIYNLMGKAYMAQGNEAAALNSFKKSLTVKPEFTLSYLDLAEIYEKRGDADFAIAQLKTAVAIESDFNDAKLRIADISLTNGNYKQAIIVYSKLVGINDYNSQALKGLADAYYAQAQISANKSLASNKDLSGALEYVNKAIGANGEGLELHLAKLKLMEITNQPEPSKVTLDKIIQSPANDLVSTILKGEAYLKFNDYKNAQKTFDLATDLSQTTKEDLCLSEIFIYHKQYENARKVLQKILKTNHQNQSAISDLDYIQKCTKHADNYFQSAKNFLKSKNLSAAIEYLSRSLAIDPNNAQAHMLLAQLYEKKKDYPEALANYKAYLGLEPNSSESKKIEKKIKNLENRL